MPEGRAGRPRKIFAQLATLGALGSKDGLDFVYRNFE